MAIKVRQLLASKGNAKAVSSEAKASTPLLRLRQQTRTTVTPVRIKEPAEQEPATSNAASLPSTTDASANDDKHGSATLLPGQDTRATELKLTLVQVPLLPKPELARPTPPVDPKAMLQKLHDLRSAAENLLGESDSQRSCVGPAGPGPVYAVVTPSRNRDTAGPAQPHHPASQLAAAAATPLPSRGPGLAASGFVSPGRLGLGGAQYEDPHARTPSGFPASPYLSTPGFGTPGVRVTGAQRAPCLSPETMVGLRQQELKDTGGGFLTHFADPRDLSTPLAAAQRGARGPGGAAAAGGSTPLSVLRSIHKVQQLQRLQREGAQLVAAMDRAPTG